MTHALTDGDLANVEALVNRAVANKTGSTIPSREGQPLAAEAFLIYIALHVVVPIVVSVCSGLLEDVLRGRRVRDMSEDDSRALLRSLVGTPVVLPVTPGADTLAILREELSPVGFDDAEIVDLCTTAQQALASPGSEAPGGRA